MEIIIVDDEPVSMTALKQLVEKQPSCHVRGFTQASAALTWCGHNDPDVIIVGYVMPELNGIDFIEHLRALPGKAETPVLMVTANPDLAMRARALRAGVNDLLNKPYDSGELQLRVSNLLVLRSKHKNMPDRSSFLPEELARRTSTGAATNQNANALLNVDMTLTRLGEDEILLGQVARVFTRTAPALLDSIDAALKGNDIERAYAEAHSLKGAVAVFEAPDVFNSIVALETQAVTYDSTAASAAFSGARVLVERLIIELYPLVRQGADRVSQH